MRRVADGPVFAQNRLMKKIRVIDSHTGGEPTRVVIDGFPDMPQATIADKLDALKRDHDHFRAAVCTEPRASEITVGALLLPPVASGSVASVIFFNNVGYLGMCGHGTIGLVATLQHLQRITPGTHHIDTSVGTVTCKLSDDGLVTLENVPSYRYRQAVGVPVDGFGEVVGDIAWGGNWFFLVDASKMPFGRTDIPTLMSFARAIRDALDAHGITGKDGAVIDHIELFGAPSSSAFDSRNFVLCPGSEYDRSPCGTGTSAKVACLAADGKLDEGNIWRQESIVGSSFNASFRRAAEGIIPIISGRAYICADATLLLDPHDPFVYGIR